MRWRDLEPLQSVPGRRALNLVLKLHEGNVMSSGHQSHLLESGELVEEHGQHHLIGLFGQIGQEQNLIGLRFQDVTSGGLAGGLAGGFFGGALLGLFALAGRGRGPFRAFGISSLKNKVILRLNIQ